MNYELLIKQAESFVSKYMRKHDNANLLFHNFANTQNVVLVISGIAKHQSLNEEESFIVMAAACFLYVGYYKDIIQPEEASANMADEFFKNNGVENATIESIKNCILATINSTPGTPLANIICDANTFYLGTENFPGYNKLRRKESELLNKITIDKNEWKRNTIQMLEAHTYYTEYCKSRLNTGKQENLERLKKKNPLLSLTANSIASVPDDEAGIDENKDKEKIKESKMNSADRTIETMFRTTSANSQRLSSQADTKAHIMISVNTIIISLILGIAVRKNEAYSKQALPVIMLLVVNLVTIIFSILATRPNVANRKFSASDFGENKVNLLFFGNFFSMDFNNYSNFMLNIMKDKQSLYITMLRNLYEQGVVLAKKYRLLKISYNVFMFGLVLSVIAFFIASKFY